MPGSMAALHRIDRRSNESSQVVPDVPRLRPWILQCKMCIYTLIGCADQMRITQRHIDQMRHDFLA
jgi:hypothetical protein